MQSTQWIFYLYATCAELSKCRFGFSFYALHFKILLWLSAITQHRDNKLGQIHICYKWYCLCWLQSSGTSLWQVWSLFLFSNFHCFLKHYSGSFPKPVTLFSLPLPLCTNQYFKNPSSLGLCSEPTLKAELSHSWLRLSCADCAEWVIPWLSHSWIQPQMQTPFLFFW